MRYLLDTDICIFIARQKPRSVADRFKMHRTGDLAMSVINYGELRIGAEKSDQSSIALARLELFIQAVPVVWDETRVLGGNPDDSIIVARRRGRENARRVAAPTALWPNCSGTHRAHTAALA